MFKKISLSIIITIVILSSINVYAEGTGLEIRVDSNSVLLGEDLQVEIVVTNPSELAGGELILNYNSNKLNFKSKNINLVDNTYLDLQSYGDSLDDIEGTTKIVFGLKKDSALLTDNEISLGTITFTAINTGDASIDIDSGSKLIKSDGSGGYIYDSISLPVSSTTINVYKKGSISGSILLDDGASGEGEIVSLYLGESEVTTTTINSDGEYSFTGLDDGEYNIIANINGYIEGVGNGTVLAGSDEIVNITLSRIKEDVNRDGIIGLEDLVAVGNVFDLELGDPGFLDDADVNDDNKIDLIDLIYITRKIQ